jgi:hypothetical protein
MPGKTKSPKRARPSVGGDQMIIDGKISGSYVAQGRNARLSVHQTTGLQTAELKGLFETVYRQIQSRPVDKNVDKEEINATVQKIEAESAKGKKANESKLERWMGDLGRMAPDILDVILASLGGPVSGFTAVFKKIAERAKKQPA